MNLENVALAILEQAVALAPSLARIVRAGAEAMPDEPISPRILMRLPAEGASAQAAADLRALAAAENGQ